MTKAVLVLCDLDSDKTASYVIPNEVWDLPLSDLGRELSDYHRFNKGAMDRELLHQRAQNAANSLRE